MIALISPLKIRKKYIQAAQRLFSSGSDQCLLSAHSLPHITLCQFDCEQEEASAIAKELEELKMNSYLVRFTGFAFIQGLEVHKDFYWAELSVAREREIMKIYRTTATIIHSHELACLNDQEDLYRPHLTLARIRLSNTIQKLPKNLIAREYFTLDLLPCIPSL
ncbi:MAG: hypothetical protein ACD_17C00078G0008 [uncultured bacterium]|nr:MAG: hypothetical protein ACD_17C00078G0008 [uncultured bacterium]OGN56448.1 MAG: hypothetical protein A2796_03430 [Chlamydiae bacterium RIFCSPHIGHO2_01_FULL_44_39]OGN57132.1 MAG: hypothetical protein A3C42_02725 [Chlamydiae bacterium RIFCSPHIGHO2_02_FULL_45_9]OGN60160.1 MAG: hypothetical protein A3D96_04905 [Chlamydiae bacterium RIFCSPHIGHO2_12_FULL_44_59]OGN67187.1 MAG: hypothetical protein A2978_01135 [Chlamydiae bacterium RIFCSPLOWO2_01_FULL_44_52]OGN67777.1 MAG: hypothetical protein A3